MVKVFLISFFSLILLHAGSYAQISENGGSLPGLRNLSGTHSLYMNSGFKMNSGSSANATVSEVKTETNFTGSIGYQYWFENQWSVNVSAGFFSAASDVNYTNVSSIRIYPVLFGISYYPQVLSLGSVGRVHFGVNTGVYIASGSRTGVNLSHPGNSGTSSVNETVFGIEPNVGIDFLVSKWIKIGPAVSYHMVSEFKDVIGKRKNYSGPVFSLNFGVLL